MRKLLLPSFRFKGHPLNCNDDLSSHHTLVLMRSQGSLSSPHKMPLPPLESCYYIRERRANHVHDPRYILCIDRLMDEDGEETVCLQRDMASGMSMMSAAPAAGIHINIAPSISNQWDMFVHTVSASGRMQVRFSLVLSMVVWQCITILVNFCRQLLFR